MEIVKVINKSNMDEREPLIFHGWIKKMMDPDNRSSNEEPMISKTDTIIHMLKGNIGNIGPGILVGLVKWSYFL